MGEIFFSDQSIKHTWDIVLTDLSDVYFQVVWQTDKVSFDIDASWWIVTISIARHEGPEYIFDKSYGVTGEVPSERRSVDFIRKVLLDCVLNTYDIIIMENTRQAIKCKICGMTSHYYMDVKYLWCGKCNTFHYDFLKEKI
jgi:hypothetical protein